MSHDYDDDLYLDKNQLAACGWTKSLFVVRIHSSRPAQSSETFL